MEFDSGVNWMKATKVYIYLDLARKFYTFCINKIFHGILMVALKTYNRKAFIMSEKPQWQ